MVRFSIRSWLNGLSLTRSRRQRKAAGSIERLETRLVLSGYSVTSTLDTVDANPGDGVAADVDGNTTLRAAVIEANASAETDVISLGSGVFTMTLGGRGEDAAATGDLDISGNLTIEGAGADQTFLDAALLDRYFHVLPGSTLTLRNVSITNGRENSGGAIQNDGTLILENAVLTGNSANIRGGAIFNNLGSVTLQSVNFVGNTATTSVTSGTSMGGALASTGGTVTIQTSQFSNNSAVTFGGAIYTSAATVNISDTAFSGNSAMTGGAIRLSGGSATLTNDTFNGDHASVSGAAIAASNSPLVMTGGSFISTYLSASTTGEARTGGAMYLVGAGTFTTVSTITNVTFQQTAGGDAGAIYNSNGQLNIRSSTFDRITGERGGAIWNANNGFVSMANATITGGSGYNGGAVLNYGMMSITSCTITGNASGGATLTSAAVENSGSLDMRNNIVAGNIRGTAPGGDFFTAFGGESSFAFAGAPSQQLADTIGHDVLGTVNVNGGNLIGIREGSSGFDPASNRLGTIATPIDPLVLPLADNGGPVKTMALSNLSPARDLGIMAGPNVDARGVPRIDNRYDAGAYEFQNHIPTISTFRATINYGETLTGQLVGADADGDPLTFFLYPGFSFPGTMTLQPNGQFTYVPPGEEVGTVFIPVFVSDGHSNSDFRYAQITVLPFNDPPEILDQTFTVPENSQNNTFIGNIFAFDPDGPQMITEIVSGNESGAFRLGSQSRNLTVLDGTKLNFEATSSYQLVVRVTDNGSPSKSSLATITIQLTDVNEPHRSTSSMFQLNENSPAGTSVGTVVCIDEDVGQAHRFEILDSNFLSTFTINSSTGEITVVDPTFLDFESGNTALSFLVQIADANNEYYAYSTLRITINDVNEAPQFIGPDSFSVAENTPQDYLVADLLALDQDFGQRRTYEIVSGNTDGAFTINPNNGEIRVANPAALNFETTPSYSLIVTATDNGTPSQTGTVTITIAVDDVNEPPRITSPLSFTLDENSPIGTAVASVTASDPDIGQILSYQIVSGDWYGTFSIDSSTGEITVADPAALDFESTRQFDLTVRVTDNGDPQRGTQRVITVSLNDVNEAPYLSSNSFTLSENSPTGTLIGITSGYDLDAGQTLTYAIESGNDNNAFAIDPVSGWISVANADALDFESNPVFNLTIRATDNGIPSRSTTASVTVELTDVNEAPLVSDQAFSVIENAANGTEVGTIIATDPDGNPDLIYAIEAGNIGNAFAIDPATGLITVANAGALDFESTSNFALTVSVTNGGSGASATMTATIQLNDQNEAPQLTAQSFSLNENSSVGTVVGTIQGTDPDAGQSLLYAIESGNINGTFSIDPVTGQITVANAAGLDFETTPVFSLVVSVTDNGSPELSTSTVVSISLANVNDAPQLLPQSLSVAENSPNGTVVGTVAASDPDAGQSLTYAILSGNTNGAFAINAATGTISVANAAVLNFEVTPAFNLIVRVTDSTTPALASTATVTIDLTNRNEAPQLNSSSFTLSENSSNGTVVGSMTGSDPDAGQSLSYSILSGNTNGAFAINAATGQIAVANSAALNYEATRSFSLVIGVTDNGTPALNATATATISLTNTNDAPQISNRSFSLNENSANNTVVGTITGTDQDPGQTLTYSITSGNTNGAFTINATTGQIRVASSAALNFELNPTFSLVVSARDNGTPNLTSSATVTVSLTNVNEAPAPVAQSFSIAENSPNGSLVGSFAASDPDAGQPLSYSITSGNTNNVFAINASTGQITVANSASLNFESKSSYSLVVRVVDNGSPSLSASATVTISVINQNEAPVISPKSFSLSENSANGTTVGTITATNPDAGQTLTYSIASGNTNGAFAINATTGKITVANSAALDFETTRTFSLVVRATDNGTPNLFADATVTITLTNANDAPIIANQSFSLAENSANGSVVGVVVASDPDAGQSRTYSIVSGNTNSAFSINSSTGRITVANSGALDFETTPTFALQVRVTDNGSPSRSSTATVTISLTDVVEPLAVSLDVIPGSSSNQIRLGTTFEVAILSTSSFDARDVNVSSIRFGKVGTENSARRNSSGQVVSSYRDVDGDGRLDLVVEFTANSTGLQAGDTLAKLTGTLNNGRAITGSSSVTVRR